MEKAAIQQVAEMAYAEVRRPQLAVESCILPGGRIYLLT